MGFVRFTDGRLEFGEDGEALRHVTRYRLDPKNRYTAGELYATIDKDGEFVGFRQAASVVDEKNREIKRLTERAEAAEKAAEFRRKCLFEKDRLCADLSLKLQMVEANHERLAGLAMKVVKSARADSTTVKVILEDIAELEAAAEAARKAGRLQRVEDRVIAECKAHGMTEAEIEASAAQVMAEARQAARSEGQVDNG